MRRLWLVGLAISAVLLLSPSAPGESSATPTTCTKTYLIQPSGEKIIANVKLTDLSAQAIASLRAKEDSKYEGYPYKPTGAPETRTQNCAGLVFQTLYPDKVQDGNIDPDEFFRKIVQPYGHRVTIRRKGDVVVYIQGNGVIKHVAIVESAPVLGTTRILTKDGDERPYVAGFPNRLNLASEDPLIRAHTGEGGHVEFWRLDRSKLRIEEMSSGECDEASQEAPTSVTLTVNGWTLVASKANPAVYLHHEQDQPLASETKLTIHASIDHPLPKGWTLTIYHNGDVLSHGNGDYYKVCELVGPSTTTSCGATRPGRVGPFDDIVWAAVGAPTYLAMHSDIYFHFNPP
jgi:hypothetical protein